MGNICLSILVSPEKFLSVRKTGKTNRSLPRFASAHSLRIASIKEEDDNE